VPAIHAAHLHVGGQQFAQFTKPLLQLHNGSGIEQRQPGQITVVAKLLSFLGSQSTPHRAKFSRRHACLVE
jgi:hypothetical protein